MKNKIKNLEITCPYCGYGKNYLIFVQDDRKSILCTVCGFTGPKMKTPKLAREAFERKAICNISCPYLKQGSYSYCNLYKTYLNRERGLSSENYIYFCCDICKK